MHRVIFFGTEQFAVRILESLLHAPQDFTVAAVVTQPARPVGRKQIVTPSPVSQFATEHAIPVITPVTLKDSAVIEQLAAYTADVFVVAQYGLIIPKRILEIPAHGAINVHASLLPKHRGASPVHGSILAGDAETGVTFMKMDALMDHGDLFASYRLPIEPADTTETLMAKLADLSAEHFPMDLKKLLSGEIVAVPQNHDDATFTKLLSRETGFIVWDQMGAATVERMTRALFPWPGVTTEIAGATFKIVAAHVESPELSGTPGKLHVTRERVWIETIAGEIVLDAVQPAGKQSMSAAQFGNGYQALDGAICAMPIANASLK